MAFGFYRTVTVDHTKVPNTDQTNFTIVVAGTVASLKSVANAGNVTVNAGAGIPDISFFSDVALTTPLKFERTLYTATTGAHAFYVKVPTVSHTVDTVIYMAYGNAAIVADPQDAVNAWDANFKAIFHFGNGSALNVTDSLGNFTLTGRNTPTATSDGIDGAMVLVAASSQDADRTTSSPVSGTGSTVEAMVKPTTVTGNQCIVSFNDGTTGALGLQLYQSAATVVAFQAGTGGSSQFAITASVLVAGTRYYAAAAFTSDSARSIYFNANAAVTDSNTVLLPQTNVQYAVGCRMTGAGPTRNTFLNGEVDEVRISNSVRSADWIATTSNSLLGFATFYTLGNETVAGLTLSFTQQPTNTVSGVAMSPTVSVQTVDNAPSIAIALTIKTGAGVISNASATTNGSGLATFPNLAITGSGAHVLTASAATYTNQDSNSVAISNATAALWQTFINANGGDSATLEAWDSGVNTTVASASDVRGSGASFMVPRVQATGSKQPTLGANGLTFDGVDDCMISALDSRITMNQAAALHTFVVMSSSATGKWFVGYSQDPTDATSKPNIYLSSTATEFAFQFNPLAVDLDVQTGLGTLLGSTPRSLFFGRQSTHPGLGAGAGDIRFYAKGHGRRGRRRLTVNTPSATGSGMKGCWGQFGTTFGAMTIRAQWTTNQTLSRTTYQNWLTFAAANFGITPDMSTYFGVLWTGTSTDRAHNTTHPIGWNPATQDGTTSAEDICAKIVPTWASQNIESNVYATTATANGHLLTDDIGLYAEDYALDLVDCTRGNHVMVIGGLLGDNFVAPYNAVGGFAAYNTLIAGYVATLVADGWKVIIRTVMDYNGTNAGAVGFYNPGTRNDAGVINNDGTNMMAVNAAQVALPSGVVAVMPFENQALTRGKINRGAPFEGSNLAADVLANFDTTGHPTDSMQAIMGAIERGVFDAPGNILGLGTTFFARSRRGNRRSALV